MFHTHQNEVLENLSETAESLTAVLGVSPEFIERWAPRRVVYPMHISDDRRTASIRIENGVPVNPRGDSVQAHYVGEIEDLRSYDEKLVPSGLGRLASYEARSIIYIPSIEGSFHGPWEPERADLTRGFIAAVGALRRLGGVEIDTFDRKERKTIAKRTDRLSLTLATVVVDYPSKIFLPPDTPTQQQATGLEQLEPLLKGRRLDGLRKKMEAIVDRKDDLPVSDTAKWEDDLRIWNLRWQTNEEWEEGNSRRAVFFDRAARTAREGFQLPEGDWTDEVYGE